MEVPINKLEMLAKEPSVKKIVQDRRVSAFRLESMALIKASNASSSFNVNGTGVNISIIDTGVFNHSEFQNPNRIIKQKCYCTGCCPPDYVDENDNATDDNGHGTNCAGIASGKGDGYTHGVATNASLIAVKVLPYTGTGGYESDFVAGIDWSVQNGANVISLSLGIEYYEFSDCYEYDLVSSEAVDNATKQGVVVVVAAGNRGPSSQTIAAPGCAKRVVTVGNSNGVDSISSSSSRGPTTDNRIKPDLTAPGTLINSTYNDGDYATMSGTSMATPHVAGVAALVIQRYNQINGYNPDPDRVKTILITAVNTTGMNASGYEQRNNVFGSGRIDAYEALRIVNYTYNRSISASQEHHYKINVTLNDFKTTLYWPEDKDTNNDLNLFVGNRLCNYSYPTSANDTVEQVFLTNASSGVWDVYVVAASGTNQTYYLASNMNISNDTIPPTLLLIKPENNTYNNQTGIPLNFTTDSTNHTIWYKVDGGNDVAVTGNNTFNVSSDGQHNITLYVNDSYDNINQSTQYFTVDTVPPIITIISPYSNLTMNHSSNSVWFNVSLNENGNVSLCSVDGNGNFTLTRLNETYFYNLSTVGEGWHNATFYVNDTVNWMNRSSINFTVMVKPVITNSNVDKTLVLFNENVNITATIDDENLNSTLVNITWPNGLSILRSMINSSSTHHYTFNETNQTGSYNVTILANDTFGNNNNASVNFIVADPVNVTSSITNGSTAVNVSVKIYYNGTSQARNQTINTSFSFILPGGLWDVGINTTQLNVTLFNTNLTQNVTRNIKLKEDVQMNYIVSDVRALKTVVLKFDNFTFSSANLTFPFNSSLVTNQTHHTYLTVYKCDDWNFTYSNCSSSWVEDHYDDTFYTTINTDNLTLVTLNFSAFSLGEAPGYCQILSDWIKAYLNEECGDSGYNSTADINKDKIINILDGVAVELNWYNETWCKEKYEDQSNPCSSPTTTTASSDGDGGGNLKTTVSISTTTAASTTTISQATTTRATTTESEETSTTTPGKKFKEIKTWYVIPIVLVSVVVAIVIMLYVKHQKEVAEELAFKRLKEKWRKKDFINKPS
jgi:serine protease AprX